MAKDQVKHSPSMVIIGGSAGSLQVVFYLLGKCRPDLKTPVLLTLHRDAQGISKLAELLATKSAIPVKEIEDKDELEQGHIYVSPPDYHTLFESDLSFSLDYSEKVHFSRPSIDVTFRSGADIFGKKLVCILLSGANADGAEGLQYVRDRHGLTIVHNPEEAEVSYMPQQALLLGKVDHVFSKAEIGEFIAKLP